jgi:hypothetical protein
VDETKQIKKKRNYFLLSANDRQKHAHEMQKKKASKERKNGAELTSFGSRESREENQTVSFFFDRRWM